MKRDLRNSRRRGFTLVELLVVIAIIGILASLAAWGVFAMVGGQKNNNTIATIKVVNKVLQSHWQYVVEEAKKDAQAGLISQAVQNLAAPDPTGERAQVLWIKFRLMEAFPQSYAEIGTATAPQPWFYTQPSAASPYIPPSQGRYNAAYQKNLPWLQTTPLGTPPASHNPATESSACLLMALSVSRGGITLTQDQIGFAIADADGDGVKELVDAWSPRQPAPWVSTMAYVRQNSVSYNGTFYVCLKGNTNVAPPTNNTDWLALTAPPQIPLVPLVFRRFDTRQSFNTSQGVQQLNPAAAGAKNAVFADPVDPDGTLLNPAWYGTASCTIFQSNLHVIETSTGSGLANYVVPSIISAGKDGGFGTQDDIISTLLR